MQRSGLLQMLPGLLNDTARKLHAAGGPAGVLEGSAGKPVSAAGSSSSSSTRSSSISSSGMESAGVVHAETSTAPSAGSKTGHTARSTHSTSAGGTADGAKPPVSQSWPLIEDQLEQLLKVWLSVRDVLRRPPQDTLLPAGPLAVATLHYLSSTYTAGTAGVNSGDTLGVVSYQLLLWAVHCLMISTREVCDGLSGAYSSASAATPTWQWHQLLQGSDFMCSLGYSLVLSMLIVWLHQRSHSNACSSSSHSSSSASGANTPLEQPPAAGRLASDLPEPFSALLQHLGCSPAMGLHAADALSHRGCTSGPDSAQSDEERLAMHVGPFLLTYHALLGALQAGSAGVEAQQQQALLQHLLLVVPVMLQWVADSPSNHMHFEIAHAMTLETASSALQYVRHLSTPAPAAMQAAAHTLQQLQLGTDVGETCVLPLCRGASMYLQKWLLLCLHLCGVSQAAAIASVPQGDEDSDTGSGRSPCVNSVDQAADILLSLVVPFTAPLSAPMQLHGGSTGKLCALLEDYLRGGLFAHNMLSHIAAGTTTTTSSSSSSASSSNRGVVDAHQHHQQLLLEQLPACFQVAHLARACVMIYHPESFSLWPPLMSHITASRSLVDPVALQLYGLLVSMLKLGTKSSSNVTFVVKHSQGIPGEEGQCFPATTLQLQQLAIARAAREVLQCCQHPLQQDPQTQLGTAAEGTAALSDEQQQYQSAANVPVSSSFDSSSTVGASVDATQQLPWLSLLGRLLLQWGGELQQLHGAYVQAVDGTAVDPQQQAGGSSSSSVTGHSELDACLQHLNMSAVAVQDVVSAVMGSLQAGAGDVMRQLSRLGYDTDVLLQLLGSTKEMVGGIQVDAESLPDGTFASSVQDLWELLLPVGRRLAAFAHPYCCNNPVCGNVEGPSEAALVGGRSCICAGCNTARYCCKPCQQAHWKQHKPVCKALATAAAAAAGAAGTSNH